MTREIIYYGGVPVPYTASWTGEETFSVGPCRWAEGRASILQNQARGVGKPQFGKPHAIRQREVIADGLCDLCAKPLRIATKVSLSHARPQLHSANGGEILQVEPLLHRRCAGLSMAHCPALKRDVKLGTLMGPPRHALPRPVGDHVLGLRQPDSRRSMQGRGARQGRTHVLGRSRRRVAGMT